MTQEQIAQRIREEFRKHAKNDPEGWPLIAAGKIRAEMRETGVEPDHIALNDEWVEITMKDRAQKKVDPVVGRYWFYSGVGKGHPLASGQLSVTNEVCTRHPFDVESDRRKLVDPEFLLMCWQEITQEEYELYQERNP